MNSSCSSVTNFEVPGFELGPFPSTNSGSPSDFRAKLETSTTKRHLCDTFVRQLFTLFEIERATLTLANDHDWNEVFSATKTDEIVLRKFVATDCETGSLLASQDGIQYQNANSEFEMALALRPSDESPSKVADASVASLMLDQGQTVGSVRLHRSITFPFDRADKDQLKALTDDFSEVLATHNRQFPASSVDHHQYAKQLEELNQVGHQLATAGSEKHVFKIVASAAERVLGAVRVSYVIPHIDRGTYTIMALQGHNAIAADTQIPLQNSCFELVMIRDQSCFFEDFNQNLYPEHRLLAKQGLRSGIAVPIHSGRQIVGVFNVATKTQWARPQEAQNLFSALGRFLESSLQRLRAQKTAKAIMDHLAKEANHDELTGLPNRSCFTKTLEEEVIACREQSRSFALLFIDLDDFKKVNDTLTHSVGDQLLTLVGQRMASQTRETDLVARLGGDEFVILIRNIDDSSQADKLANRLLESIQTPFQIGDREVSVGGSIGLSLFPEHGRTVAELMMHSDIAMYGAKDKGGNNCQAYTSLMAKEIQERIELSDDLEVAMRNDDLCFAYQPQLSVDTNRTLGVEALVRWNHPQRGWISPGVFIPFAEETGLITDITALALNQTLSSVADLRKIDANIYGSVNISAVDFADLKMLMKRIEKALVDNQLPGNALELELTERIFLEYTDDAKAAIETWKQNGIRLAIDDFGTGFSSLKYLLDLQIDTLKIDQSFIRSLQENPRQRGIVETILKMGASLGAICVAEGVETIEELQCLKDLGCQVYQGYYGCRPLALDKITEFIETD